MTELRDQFAMAALQGLLASYDYDYRTHAHDAYEIADAMLAARAPAREPTVDDLDLSVRAANFLHKEGIETIAHLKLLNVASLRDRGATAKTTKEIFAELKRSGL